MPELTLYTIKEAAALLRCSYNHVWYHMHGYVSRKGKRVPVDLLPYRQVGPRDYRIEATVLDVFTNRYNDWASYQKLLRQYSTQSGGNVSRSIKKAA